MVLSRLTVEGMLPVVLMLQCSAALCANRSGVMFTLTHVGLQMMMVFVVVALAFSTSIILMATKERTLYHTAFSGSVVVSKCPIYCLSVLLIPGFRVFWYEWRPSVFRLTDSSPCLWQIPIRNKSRLISIFGQYYSSKIIISCTYCLPSDHKCGGENFSFTSSLYGSPLLQVQNTTVLGTLVQCRPTAFCHCSMPQHKKVRLYSARSTVWHLWNRIPVIHQDVGHVSSNGHAFPCNNPAQM